MAKVNNSIFHFLTKFSVQLKVIFLMVFLISGIIFWNLSYYSVTKKSQLLHEHAVTDFSKVAKIAALLKAIQDERFVSVMYLHNHSEILALQSIRKETDSTFENVKSLAFESSASNNILKKIIVNIEALKVVRKKILKREYDSEDSIRYYTDKLSKHTLELIQRLIQPIKIKSLIAYSDLQTALEFTTLHRDLTFVVMSKNKFDIDWFERLNMVDARAQAYFDHYKMNASSLILEKYRDINNRDYFININQLKQDMRDFFNPQVEEPKFDSKLWYISANSYVNNLRVIVEMQQELILNDFSNVHNSDIKESDKNLILLLLPLLFIIVVAFYFFLDMRFALSVILNFLNSNKDDSLEEKAAILKEAKNEFGDVYRALIRFSDEVAEQIEINKKTYEYDSLTELPNRVKLLHTVEKHIKKERYISIFYIDIFNFSHINNSFGQEVGDTFLKESAKELANLLHTVGEDEYHSLSAYRVGSDEFVILCQSEDKEEEITQLLQRTYLVECHDIVIPLSFTFGISKGDEKTTSSLLLSNAEMATTFAKEHHKHFENFEPYMIEEANHQENLEWVKKISNAFENGLFEVHYQPIFETVTKNLLKYEVLIRMIDAKNSEAIISPSEFLEILQKSGHEKDLTKVIIDQSFASFEACGVDLSINMTSDDLDDDMVEYLVNEVNKHQINPSNITVELVESEELLKTRYIDIIQKIKGHGFQLAIDDFGTGYSNFAYLTQIKPDYIKIDGSLVKDICENEQHARVVEGIYDFAQSLEIKTIAEFVSSEEIYNNIKEIGIEYVQGFYLGKVMSCDTIKKMKEDS